MEARTPHTALSPELRAVVDILTAEMREEIRLLREELGMVRLDPDEPVPDWEIKPLYSYQEAATIWSVSYRSVQNLVAAGDVVKVQSGAGPRIPHDDVIRVWRKGVRRRSGRRRKKS